MRPSCSYCVTDSVESAVLPPAPLRPVLEPPALEPARESALEPPGTRLAIDYVRVYALAEDWERSHGSGLVAQRERDHDGHSDGIEGPDLYVILDILLSTSR